LPGNLEEMQYWDGAKRKMIFFLSKMMHGLDFSRLFAHTSVPFGDGELSALIKKSLGWLLKNDSPSWHGSHLAITSSLCSAFWKPLAQASI